MVQHHSRILKAQSYRYNTSASVGFRTSPALRELAGFTPLSGESGGMVEWGTDEEVGAGRAEAGEGVLVGEGVQNLTESEREERLQAARAVGINVSSLDALNLSRVLQVS